jgi:uncharacterized protein
VKADPEAQRRLLDLQAIDTSLAQIAHRRRNLPELATLDRLARELAAAEDERIRVQVSVDDLDRDIARFERDIEQVRTRADKDRARLDVGTGPARELEALQHELGTLARRQSELEDSELELMEQREAVQATLDEVQRRLASTRQTRDELQVRCDETLADLDRDRAAKETARAPLVANLATELVSLYEKIRESSGMGAALLRAGRCEGCRLELAGSERSRVKAAAPDEVVRCDECGRILVRTAESGL